MPIKSTRSKVTIIRQLCELIPPFMVAKLATEHGIRSRAITPWSHVVSLVYAQFTHALGLNDVCDSLNANRSGLYLIRGAKPPSKNGLSNANRTRDPAMAESLFWFMLEHLQTLKPRFGGPGFGRMQRRFKRTVHLVDSTTIQLFVQCMDWAKHRRRKAAAKMHLRLDLASFLPAFIVIDSAKGHDNTKAHELCAGVNAGEIVVFDMAYIDYEHLNILDQRGVFWVTRVKSNMQFRCVKHLTKEPVGRILKDELVLVKDPKTRTLYPKRMRRVTARVDVNGEDKVMVFFTNNLEWSAQSICDLYKSRWAIEVFFKHIKQNLRIGDFLGYNRNAIEWQLWTALLTYLLLRYLHAVSDWEYSFMRLFTALRAVLWQNREAVEYLRSYGTAGEQQPSVSVPQQAFLPGLVV